MKQTSIQAHNAVKPTKKQMHNKIISALKVINNGSFRDIASYLALKDEQVWKRLSELERKGLIELAGVKKCEVTNRNVSIYQLNNS